MRGTPEDFSGDFEIFDLYELELHNVLLLNVLPTSYYNFFFSKYWICMHINIFKTDPQTNVSWNRCMNFSDIIFRTPAAGSGANPLRWRGYAWVELAPIIIARIFDHSLRSCAAVGSASFFSWNFSIRTSWQSLPWCNLWRTNLREFFRPLGRSRRSQPFAGYRCSAAKEMFWIKHKEANESFLKMNHCCNLIYFVKFWECCAIFGNISANLDFIQHFFLRRVAKVRQFLNQNWI